MQLPALRARGRVKAPAPGHPERIAREPVASLHSGDVSNARAGGEQALLENVMTTRVRRTIEQFETTVGM